MFFNHGGIIYVVKFSNLNESPGLRLALNSVPIQNIKARTMVSTVARRNPGFNRYRFTMVTLFSNPDQLILKLGYHFNYRTPIL